MVIDSNSPDDLQALEQWLNTQRQQADVRAERSRNQAIRSKVLAEVWGEVKRRIKEHRPKEERGA